MFSKRHYEFLARAYAEIGLTEDQVKRMADAFCRDNPKFQPEKFLGYWATCCALRAGKES